MRKSLFKHLTDRGIQVGALVTNPSVPVYKCLPQNTASCTLSLFCSIPTTSIRAAEVKLCVSVCGWEKLLLQKRCRHWHVLCARVWFQVYIWVLNEEEDFQRAFDLGATGIMTDFPSRLKDFMDRRGISKLEWREKMCRRPGRPRCNVVFWSCVLSLLLRCSVHTLYSHPVFPVTVIHWTKVQLFLLLLTWWAFSTLGATTLLFWNGLQYSHLPLWRFGNVCRRRCTYQQLSKGLQSIYNWFGSSFLLTIATEEICGNAPVQWGIALAPKRVLSCTGRNGLYYFFKLEIH